MTGSPQKVPISVFIITHNEEQNIRACLESVTWADEIVLLDDGSEDETIAIAKEFTDKIHIKEWRGFAEQKRAAMALCSHEWALSLDADERVRPELADEIARLLAGNPGENGYRIARRSYFLNKWMKHCGWYPGYQVRLFRREKTTVSRSRVHEGFLVQGSIGTLQNDIDHYSHPSLHDSLAKLNRYSSLEALDRLDRKKVRWYDFLTHPLSAFWIKYIAQKGFLDGMHGFLLSWISAFLKMVMYMKLWWLQRLDESQLSKYKETLR